MGVTESFGYVLFAVVAFSAIVAVIAISGAGEVYRQIGRGGLSLNEDPPPKEQTTAAVRDDEIRQMLEARNARRRARGQPEVDVEAELAQLTRPAADPQLVAEIRQLVVARNARRVRMGKEPLDIEAEVARQLRELG